MYSPNFVIGIYGPKSIQKHITVETEAAPYEITIGLLEICSLGHRRQIWHNHRKVDVWDDIWTSYRDLVFFAPTFGSIGQLAACGSRSGSAEAEAGARSG